MYNNRIKFSGRLLLFLGSLLCSCDNTESDFSSGSNLEHPVINLEFEKAADYSNNSAEYNVERPTEIEIGKEKILTKSYLMLNRNIEFVDPKFDSLVKKIPGSNKSLELLFKRYFKDEKYDWTVNLVLKKKIDLWAINLNHYLPGKVSAWRSEMKDYHFKIWSAYFQDTTKIGDFSMLKFKDTLFLN